MKRLKTGTLITMLGIVALVILFCIGFTDARQLSYRQMHLITGTECDGCLDDEPCGPLCQGNSTKCEGCDPSGQIEAVVPRSRPTCCTGQGTGSCTLLGQVKCEVAYPCEQHHQSPAICLGRGSASDCEYNINGHMCYWYTKGDSDDPNGLNLDTYGCNTGM